MISSSYFPPATSTPQRDRESAPAAAKSGSSSIKSGSPSDFKSMPVNEMLSSANSRSAFLQSLQRSREREERREKELQNERVKERESESKDHIYGTGYSSNSGNNFDSSTFGSSSLNDSYKDVYNNNDYNTKDGYSKVSYSNTDHIVKDSYTTKDSYSKDSYSNKDTFNNNYGIKDTPTNKDSYNSYNSYDNYTTATSSSNVDNQQSGTPIMSRRRLSSPKAPSSTPLKPLTSSTPVSQSKLASHAFTMSRSSSAEEEFNANERDNEQIEKVNDFKSKYEQEFSIYNRPQPQPQTPTTSQSHSHDDLRVLVESVMEPHTASLKNDLQNLHIELIKQSVAQQSAFRSLLETYLPLTGKLMESLRETREENERLKMRIEELSRRY